MVVVFDIGNVLLRWNPRNLFRKVFADEAAMEQFLSTACAMDWIVETDRARSFQPALDARIAAFPQYARELRLFDESWVETLGGPIAENVALLERLIEQGERIYSITNFCDAKFEVASALYPFLNRFDGIIVSGREGLVKPDPRVFELFLTRYGFAPDEVLFIDDSERNVVAARAGGMQAIHYSEGVDLTAELNARGLLNSPRAE
jgi:FMN phosphatase YigB (HAD superfamily)